jgi:hypothetical protein
VVDAYVVAQLARYPGEPRLRGYLASRRGRSYLRMTLRNRKLVDGLIDRAAPPAATEGAATEETEIEPRAE